MAKKLSEVKNLIPKTVNPDLQKERLAAEFDVEEFAAWWQGGEQKLKTKREVGKCEVEGESLSLSLMISLACIDKKVQVKFVFIFVIICGGICFFLVLLVSKFSKCTQSPVDNIQYLII